MLDYVIYQLSIRSECRFPELAEADKRSEPDITIRLLDKQAPEFPDARNGVISTKDGVLLYWQGLGTFELRNGMEILIRPVPGTPDELIRRALLGPVLGILLDQRGRFVLHASAVAIRDKGVAFTGNKGQGKSTMVAAAYARGHSVIADDVVALENDREGPPLVLPGYPQLKLWPDTAVNALGDNLDSLPRLGPDLDKRVRRVENRFVSGPLPLSHIYVLAEGPVPRIVKLRPQEAMIQLIANTYVAPMGQEYLHGKKAATHVAECASLLQTVRVCRFERPLLLSLLPEHVRFVEQHVETGYSCSGT